MVSLAGRRHSLLSLPCFVWLQASPQAAGVPLRLGVMVIYPHGGRGREYMRGRLATGAKCAPSRSAQGCFSVEPQPEIPAHFFVVAKSREFRADTGGPFLPSSHKIGILSGTRALGSKHALVVKSPMLWYLDQTQYLAAPTGGKSFRELPP